MKLHVYLALGYALALTASARAATMIETYGHYQPPAEPWLVDVSDAKLTLGHGAVSSKSTVGVPLVAEATLESNITTAVSPKWNAHSGWFVFVDSSRKIWAYDGADSLLFDETTPKGGRTCLLEKSFNTIPEMPPKEVYSRLPEKMQQALQAKFPAKH